MASLIFDSNLLYLDMSKDVLIKNDLISTTNERKSDYLIKDCERELIIKAITDLINSSNIHDVKIYASNGFKFSDKYAKQRINKNISMDNF
jgi:hypothetical protein